MDKRIFLFLIVLVAFTVEAKKKILKKKLNQLKGKEEGVKLKWFKLWLIIRHGGQTVQVMYSFEGRQILAIAEDSK